MIMYRPELHIDHQSRPAGLSLFTRISVLYCLIAIAYFAFSIPAMSQEVSENLPPTFSAEDFKKLSMEQLLEMEVTSVSRSPERLSQSASAIQVITREDILRSGATNLPEALRLASNLQVAEIHSNAWIISARGFNYVFANKLLVMIDGRTVYSPLFAGVYWDEQSVLMEDIDRIEVISGPGGTMWGANAVNGIINIITKNAAETQGIYYSRAAGNHLRSFDALRYGGKIGEKLHYRVFGQYSIRDHTLLPSGEAFADRWDYAQGGFQLDYNPSENTNVMVQGNLYTGTEESLLMPSTIDGQNIMGRWQHAFSKSSKLMFQTYFDRAWRRDIPSTFRSQVHTFDFEFQHSFALGKSHQLLWGGGYRHMNNVFLNTTEFVGFVPNKRKMELYSAFVHDEFTLVPEKLRFIAGVRLQHNVFTDFEFQPNARLAWTPDHRQVIWTAVSRAVRAPSRIDVDYSIPTYPVPSDQPSVAGGPDFESEVLISYELGYRIQTSKSVRLSVSGFYSDYDQLFSVEALPNTLTYQIVNGSQGISSGIEISGTWQVNRIWRLNGGYTWFNKELSTRTELYPVHSLGNDARHATVIQSMLDISDRFRFDVVARGRTRLSNNNTPAYLALDGRLSFEINQCMELSLVAQNLSHENMIEFGNRVTRSFYAQLRCRF